MIPDLLQTAFFSALEAWVSAWPEITVPSFQLPQVGPYLGWLSAYIDISALFAVVAISVLIEAASFSFRLLWWIYEHIPVIG